jgi:hypothetical protein
MRRESNFVSKKIKKPKKISAKTKVITPILIRSILGVSDPKLEEPTPSNVASNMAMKYSGHSNV